MKDTNCDALFDGYDESFNVNLNVEIKQKARSNTVGGHVPLASTRTSASTGQLDSLLPKKSETAHRRHSVGDLFKVQKKDVPATPTLSQPPSSTTTTTPPSPPPQPLDTPVPPTVETDDLKAKLEALEKEHEAKQSALLELGMKWKER